MIALVFTVELSGIAKNKKLSILRYFVSIFAAINAAVYLAVLICYFITDRVYLLDKLSWILFSKSGFTALYIY